MGLQKPVSCGDRWWQLEAQPPRPGPQAGRSEGDGALLGVWRGSTQREVPGKVRTTQHPVHRNLGEQRAAEGAGALRSAGMARNAGLPEQLCKTLFPGKLRLPRPPSSCQSLELPGDGVGCSLPWVLWVLLQHPSVHPPWDMG